MFSQNNNRQHFLDTTERNQRLVTPNTCQQNSDARVTGITNVREMPEYYNIPF
jgi:hypothetical protein